MRAIQILDPKLPQEQKHICTACYGPTSFDIAHMHKLGTLAYVERMDRHDEKAPYYKPGIILINHNGQGHDGILAGFKQKPLPSPKNPFIEENYIMGSNDKAEEEYDQWVNTYLCSSPIFIDVDNGSDWALTFDRTWTKFSGHIETILELIDSCKQHHGYKIHQHQPFAEWLLQYCANIIHECETTFNYSFDWVYNTKHDN